MSLSRWWIPLAACALALAAACDDEGAVDGSRAACASGGGLGGGCPDDPATPEGACSRLVACGAIPLDAPDDKFDWGQCVDRLDGVPADQRAFATACIAASTCDELRVNGSPGNPYERIFCLNFGVR